VKRYLISYDLRQPHKDYTTLHDHLKNGYASATRPLASVWIIQSTRAYDAVRDNINAYIDKDDKLLVIDVTNQATAWVNINRSDLNF